MIPQTIRNLCKHFCYLARIELKSTSMKLNFDWKDDGKYHQYCLSCHAEKVERVYKDDKTFYLCGDCGKTNERSIVIDPVVKWWLDKNGEYWHESAGVFVKNNKGQFLFFERTIFPFSYTVPAGHVDANEEPLQSAIRELDEEVGIKAENLVDIASEDIIGDSCRRGSDAHKWHAFLYEVDETPGVEIKEEGTKLSWLSLEDALEKELTFPVRYILNKYKEVID